MDDDFDPLSQREQFYLDFPKWFVDYVLAPFDDEVGEPFANAKWLVVGAILTWCYVSLFPLDYQSDAAFGVIIAAVAVLIAILCFSRNRS